MSRACFHANQSITTSARSPLLIPRRSLREIRARSTCARSLNTPLSLGRPATRSTGPGCSTRLFNRRHTGFVAEKVPNLTHGISPDAMGPCVLKPQLFLSQRSRSGLKIPTTMAKSHPPIANSSIGRLKKFIDLDRDGDARIYGRKARARHTVQLHSQEKARVILPKTREDQCP